MEKADNCPYCGASLEKKHPLVGYKGSAGHGTATRLCQDTGMKVNKELIGRSAELAQEEFNDNTNKPDIQDESVWGGLKKAFRILMRLPW